MFVRNLRAAVTFTKLRVTYKRDILIIRQSKKYQLRLNSLYKLISLICFLSSSISIKSAEIRGRIIDAQRGQPIRGANVFVSPGEIEAQSKDDGRFILLGVPKSEVNIKISSIGFTELNLKKHLYKELSDLGLVTLSSEVIKLDEILVNDASMQTHHSLSSLDLVPNEDGVIDSDLADSLSDLPGITKGAMGPNATRPVLRGYSGDRFKITEGGITLGDLSQTSADHAVANDMVGVESIEIVRGPKSLIFGSNTIAGVIDIRKWPDSYKQASQRKYSFKSGYQSVNNGAFGSFALQAPFNGKQLRFHSLRRKTDNLKTANGLLQNTGLDKYQFSVGIVDSSDWAGSNFSLDLLGMNYGIPGTKSGHITGVTINLGKSQQRFHYFRYLSSKIFKKFDIDQSYIHYDHSEFVTKRTETSVNLNQKIFALQSKLTGPKITAGMLLQLREFMASGFYWTPDTREINFAIFSLYERRMFDWAAQASLRSEFLMVDPKAGSHRLSNMKSSEVIRRYFSSLSAAFQISKNWSDLETSISTMLTGKAPQIEELYSDGPHLGTYSYEIGNPNLGLERTIGIETNAKYVLSKGWFRLSSYLNYSPNFLISSKMGDGYKPGADWIEWGSGSAGWLYKYRMLGAETIITGLEADFMYSSKYAEISGNLSSVLGHNLDTNKPLILIPPPKATLNIEFNPKGFLTKFQIERSFGQNRLGIFETKTAPYVLVNVHSVYNFGNTISGTSHRLALYMNNIFDAEYYNHLSRIKDIMPEAGRSLSLQYEIDF